MNKTRATLLLVPVIALSLAGCTTSRPDRSWEYKSESTYPEGTGGVVTRNCEQGWQFVSMAAAAKAPNESPTVVLLFKRPNNARPAPTALFKGAVAHWEFEGNGQDSIGHHNLTLKGAGYGRQTVSYTSGKKGLAMSQTGNTPSFQLPEFADLDCNRDFTLSVWLYRAPSIYDNDAVFDNGAIYLAKRDAAPWNSRMGVYLNTSDKRSIDLVDNSPLGEPPLNTWFHVLVFRRGNTMGIQVNNEGTATVDVSNMHFENRPATYVGQQHHGYPWQGRLDELCLWNRALSAQEMSTLYHSGPDRCP